MSTLRCAQNHDVVLWDVPIGALHDDPESLCWICGSKGINVVTHWSYRPAREWKNPAFWSPSMHPDAPPPDITGVG